MKGGRMLQLLTYTTYLDFIQDGPADLPCKKGCTTNNFPLLLQDVQIELHEQEFNHNFITNFFRDPNGVRLHVIERCVQIASILTRSRMTFPTG